MNAIDVMQARLTEQNVFRALTLFVFFAVVGRLLVATDFLPYGTDNNETFSSILHAKNMYLHGWSSFFGLTNETTSLDTAAQAFVYTHQGNFPRFYALLLYVMGARSAELQIFLTTFTVGIAGILFAHVYMEKRVNPLFAFIFCSVLITDYIMSLQWLVNTWRVWHLFFFFASLLLAHALSESASNKRMAGLCAILFFNFACLFYFELIFAAFVSIFFGFYLGYLLWRQPKKLVLGWAVAALGGVGACAILVLQIIGHLGWDVFLADLRFTFLSRNASPDGLDAFKEGVQAFMRDNKLVFWDNFILSSTPFRDPIEFVRLTFYYSLMPQTPLLVLISLLLIVGAWMRLAAKALAPRLLRRPQLPLGHILAKPIRHEDAAALLIPLFVLFALVIVISGASYGVTAPRFYLVANSRIPFLFGGLLATSAVVFFFSSIYGRLGAAKLPGLTFLFVLLCVPVAQFFISAAPQIGVLSFALLLLTVVGLAALLWYVLAHRQFTGLEVGIATFFLLSFSLFALIHAEFYQTGYAPVSPHFYDPAWREIISSLGGHVVWKTIIMATALLAVLMVLGVFDDSKAPMSYSLARISGVIPYAAIGFLAYIVIYMIVPGYIFSAYQNRHCPFAVYLTDLPLAAAIYVLCAIAIPSGKRFLDSYRSSSSDLPGSRAAALSSIALLIAVTGAWLTIQAAYLQRIPPDRVAPMFRALKSIAGHTSVVSNYATPIAVQTGAWSYYDPMFFSDGAFFDGRSPQVSPRDFRYLWLGDWKTNPAYQKPEYFVCWLQLNFYDMVSKANWNKCQNLPGVRDVRNHDNVYFDHEEVARDQRADLWSIIKLDWGSGAPGR